MSPTFMPMRSTICSPSAASRFAIFHSGLHFRGAAQGANGTRKLDEQSLAGRFDNTAAILGDSRIEEFAAVGSQTGERAFLVGTHHAGVTDYVRGENSHQSPVRLFLGHA
jgi:hypothetical protein